jgi:uncharacterized protein (TIGR02588 family)
MSGRLPRSHPEWVTFGVSAGLLAVMIGLIIGQAWGPVDAAQPKAERAGATQKVGGRFAVEVAVSNSGEQAAQNVQVVGEILVAGEVAESGDQTIDFLAGGETATVVFVFDRDPDERSPSADSGLRVYITGFTEP